MTIRYLNRGANRFSDIQISEGLFDVDKTKQRFLNVIHNLLIQ